MNKLLILFLLTVSLFSYSAVAQLSCWVNVYSEVGCPKNYTSIVNADGREYSVFCFRNHVNGYKVAYNAPVGYAKNMYCPESVGFVMAVCTYTCIWTEIGGPDRFLSSDYKLIPTMQVIEQVFTPCAECSSD